jgi:hypothetical protein
LALSRGGGLHTHFAPWKPSRPRSLLRQEQVLRAGLGEDVQPLAARPADLLDRLGARHVHDQDRHVDQLGQRDRAVGGLALDRHRPRQPVEARRGLALRHQPLGQEGDRVGVLGVDHRHRACSRATSSTDRICPSSSFRSS